MLARLLLSLLLLLGAAMPASAAGIGVVLLHGKTGTPAQLTKLATALEAAGYSVETPELCWSKARIFDAALPDCLKDVDAAVADLKTKGATAIVVGGTSQGAMAAIDYAVATPGLAGVIAMAPAADPNDASKFPDFAASIKAAQADVKAGKGAYRTAFSDLANGQTISVNASAAAFLSFHDPSSPIATLRNLKAMLMPKLHVPLLWISGSSDPTQSGAQSVFAAAPSGARNRFMQVDADHVGTPDASGAAIIAWLKTLP